MALRRQRVRCTLRWKPKRASLLSGSKRTGVLEVFFGGLILTFYREQPLKFEIRNQLAHAAYAFIVRRPQYAIKTFKNYEIIDCKFDYFLGGTLYDDFFELAPLGSSGASG